MQKQKYRFVKLFRSGIAIIAIMLFVIPKQAKAQPLSLSLWPPLLEVMIQPGKSITQVYKLSNNGETDLALTSLIVPFSPSGELGNLQLAQQLPGDWFSFQNANLDLGQKFLLKPGETQEIVLKIKIPENALEKDFYYTLLFETMPDVFLNRSNIQTVAKIGGNILLTISQTGNPLKKAEIVEFKIRNPLFAIGKLILIDSFTKPQFLLRIKNTGQAFFKPAGTITVTGWLNQKYVLDLLPENVLVDSTRQIGCETTSLDNKLCQIKSKFLIGPYSAKVEFGLDSLKTDYLATTTFLALPIRPLLGVLAAIAILWFARIKLPIDKPLFK